MTLTSSIPVLRVSDYPRAKAFWTQALGFTLADEGGDPARFGVFKREGATVFVDAWHGGDVQPSPGWRAYFHTDDLAEIDTALKNSGAVFKGPTTTEYGMPEIEVTDPDGNVVCFGQDAE